jgi:outer membrane protein TolC
VIRILAGRFRVPGIVLRGFDMAKKNEEQTEETVSVRFTQTRTVQDRHAGTDREERYEDGEVYDLPLSSAERWLRRKACQLVEVDADGNTTAIDVAKELGGGWYLLPSGEKVRGKEAAGLA